MTVNVPDVVVTNCSLFPFKFQMKLTIGMKFDYITFLDSGVF